jgi:hypothetical protein
LEGKFPQKESTFSLLFGRKNLMRKLINALSLTLPVPFYSKPLIFPQQFDSSCLGFSIRVFLPHSGPHLSSYRAKIHPDLIVNQLKMFSTVELTK